jgi:hypothetical protein
MPYIEWTRWVDDEDGEHQETDRLPAVWIICDTCSGNGAHSHHLGAITHEDRCNDWDEESWEEYMDGGYDRRCEDCKGTGKVLVVDETACPKDLLKKYQSWMDFLAECEREDRVTSYYESGGSSGSPW